MTEDMNNKEHATEMGRKKFPDLIDFILLFWNEKKKIIYITAGFIVIGLIYALLSDPWYKATVNLLPTEGGSNRILNQYSNLAALAGINLGGDTGDKYALYPEIIKSNFILDRILKHKFKTKTFENPVTLFEFWDTEIDSSKKNWRHKMYEEAKIKLKENYINVSIDKLNNLLTMDIMVPRDPLLAANLANFILEQLEIYNKHYRHYKASDQKRFINQSLHDTKISLAKAEKNMRGFLEENRDYTSPEKKLQYERLETELDVQRNLYVELRKQLELAKIAEIKETETLDILNRAVEPIKKFKPKRLIILIIFALLGFVISIFTIIFRQFYFNLKTAIFAKK